jgi:hypothetical protein
MKHYAGLDVSVTGGHRLNRSGMTVSHKGEREIRIQGSA